jgi:hypothetical protein
MSVSSFFINIMGEFTVSASGGSETGLLTNEILFVLATDGMI